MALEDKKEDTARAGRGDAATNQAAVATAASQPPATDHRPPPAPALLPALLYDGGENHSVFFEIKRGEKVYLLEHVFAPFSDQKLIDYDKRRHTKIITDGSGEARTESASVQASLWLWEQQIIEIKGIGSDEATPPPDWKTRIPHQQKLKAVDEALLAVSARLVEKEASQSEAALSWDELNLNVTSSVIELECLQHNLTVVTTHEMTSPSAADLADYRAIMTDARALPSTRLSEIVSELKPRMKRLADQYDRLCLKADGYVSFVPLHHKASVLITHLNSSEEQLVKN